METDPVSEMLCSSEYCMKDKVNKSVILNSDMNPDLWDRSSAISTLIFFEVQDLIVTTMKSMVS
jgi:hypothetical protein